MRTSVALALVLIAAPAGAQMGAIPNTGSAPNRVPTTMANAIPSAGMAPTAVPRGSNDTIPGNGSPNAIPGNGSPNAIPGNGSPNAIPGNGSPNAIPGNGSPNAIPGNGSPNAIPGNADIPGASATRRRTATTRAGVTYPVLVPAAQQGTRPPEATPGGRPAAEPQSAATADPSGRVELRGDIPPVNGPGNGGGFREVAARRSLVDARQALRDALDSRDPSAVAEARQALERARVALRDASDDAERSAWLESLEARRARLAGLREDPQAWEAHVAMQRRARWSRIRAQQAAAADISPEARAELRTHAQRMARLRRVRHLATQAGNESVVQRVDGIADREVARHAARLRSLGLRGDLEEGL